MTRNHHQPSGLNFGISFLINPEWTPEQALAVHELLKDLSDNIWSHYCLKIQELIQEQQAPADHRDDEEQPYSF
ncbi:hypothetical protein NLM31_20245 [Bradyrhizobium sp. CCGUVB4N]|uniref:hypothetical protein n=1 Tax=Bradyrhizobium sp. CCGUVB4N TaxID=2949631 RepID=UPI0020B22682|nr:hypothetical protein [Bradyrhizobium sp. CCGUVB4N]MCP3380020.1 hypothetical protein [Bradyrhizobium sp. CCGUVB4N]MCP3380283.1 hypothetical protein [Bradyrhizobium sp. CCGUVB4N]MCP3380340.1 hypothetical protein [Bradyrhizobium sp. CCGUVB4N]MCP3380373.1 hypothetical protein [Bradyrhizobium sp. CCGUVB4N]MCP3382698.1 hypothetical protein [Bradyrhizobium sp. CCGUVB4N]